jgi:hypothetical protein
MTTTTVDTAAPSRTPLLAAFGIAAASVLTAVGTFWAVNDKPEAKHEFNDWLICLPIIAVAAAVVYGLVVRSAATGNPGRRALILSVVGFLSLAVFWAGIPMVVVSGAVACALVESDKLGSYGAGSKVAFALSAVTTGLAVFLAIEG